MPPPPRAPQTLHTAIPPPMPTVSGAVPLDPGAAPPHCVSDGFLSPVHTSWARTLRNGAPVMTSGLAICSLWVLPNTMLTALHLKNGIDVILNVPIALIQQGHYVTIVNLDEPSAQIWRVTHDEREWPTVTPDPFHPKRG